MECRKGRPDTRMPRPGSLSSDSSSASSGLWGALSIPGLKQPGHSGLVAPGPFPEAGLGWMSLL